MHNDPVRSSFAWFRLHSVFFLAVCLVGSSVQSNNSVINSTLNPNPTEWNSMCKSEINETGTIFLSCHVPDEHSWDFRYFRNWSASLPNDTLLVLDLVCDAGGRVCMPWPYRALHLHTVRLRACLNTCYDAEFDQPEVLIPDGLKVLEEYSVTVQIDYTKLMNVPVDPDVECGPLNLEIFIRRNSSSVVLTPFGELPLLDDEETTDKFTENIGTVMELEHVCRYRDMRVFDYSDTADASTTFLYTMMFNSRFPELRVLNLSRLQLPSVPSVLQVWRRLFLKLDTLDLSHNNISRFDLSGMSVLYLDVGRIDLTGNNIRTVGHREIQSFKNVKRAIIDIRGNPLTCDCAMSNFTNFLQTYPTTDSANLHDDYSYLWELTCRFPAQFEGKRVADITPHVLCSVDVSSYIAQISVLSVTVVLLLIAVIAMAKYRKEVRMLVFTRFHIMLPCQPVETSTDKMYDAFVSYSHLDTAWVIRTLLPRLESVPGSDGSSFRLCLHQRDFEVGAAIADNIVQSVEASRHTILILSKNFLESEWCLMEFRTAFHQSLIEKRKHLIIVLLEDIPVHDLDADLRRCLQTMTYIQVSDRLFWDRIIYSITDKRRSKRMRSVTSPSGLSNTSASDSKEMTPTRLESVSVQQVQLHAGWGESDFQFQFSDL